MSGRRAVVLSLIERGWQPARACSLDVPQQIADIVYFVKGKVGPDVHALVALKPNMRLRSVPKGCFWPFVWTLCAWMACLGKKRIIMVDNVRSLNRLLAPAMSWAAPVVLVRPSHSGYELWHEDRLLSPEDWTTLLRAP